MRKDFISMETEKFRVELLLNSDEKTEEVIDVGGKPRLVACHYWRFYVYVIGDMTTDGPIWVEPEFFHTYSTRLPANVSTHILGQALAKVLCALESNGDGITMQTLSWMNESWFTDPE